MRVNVESSAFSDPRFKKLGQRLGITWFEAIGRCLPVWTLAYNARSPVMPPDDIDAVSERPGFAEAMIASDLATAHPDGIWVRGVADRIDFLLIQDAKRERANQAKRIAAGLTPDHPRAPPKARPTGDAPGRAYSLAPDIAPDHALAQTPIAPLQGGSSAASRSRRSRRAKPSDATVAELASAKTVLERLGKAADIAYRGCDSHVRLIVDRLRDGVSELELRAVIAYCADEWNGKPDMQKYLRPETLFGPQTISKYLDAARSRYAREIAEYEAKPKLEVVK